MEKALELDDQLAEAHTSMASLHLLNEWDFQNAERQFKSAISLKANYATTHHWYAEYLSVQGRMEEAFERRAESLLSSKTDPKLDRLRGDPRFAELLKRIGLGN